jgi:hypothetical protein
MTCFNCSVSCRRIGIGLRSSTRKGIGICILYEHDSTLIQSLSSSKTRPFPRRLRAVGRSSRSLRSPEKIPPGGDTGGVVTAVPGHPMGIQLKAREEIVGAGHRWGGIGEERRALPPDVNLRPLRDRTGGERSPFSPEEAANAPSRAVIDEGKARAAGPQRRPVDLHGGDASRHAARVLDRDLVARRVVSERDLEASPRARNTAEYMDRGGGPPRALWPFGERLADRFGAVGQIGIAAWHRPIVASGMEAAGGRRGRRPGRFRGRGVQPTVLRPAGAASSSPALSELPKDRPATARPGSARARSGR